MMRVCVVGCGSSGLASIKSCLEQGLEVVAYEQDDSIGGIWYYTEEIRENQGAAAYERLVSNSSKELFCFSDFPFPDHVPQYVPHKDALEYFKSYATHFDLWRCINLGTRVVSVERSGSYDRTGKWKVVTKKHGSDERQEEFDAVMISSGIFRKPKIPEIPGLQEFSGEVKTAAEFRKGEVFSNQNVLVIGNSFSAGDMAAEVAHFAKQVYLAVGDGTWIYPPNIGGNQPSDFLFTRQAAYWTSKATAEKELYNLCNSYIDHIRTGLASEKPPCKAGAMVNADLGTLINYGKVTVKGYVEAIKGSNVIFQDKSTVGPIDHILIAAGYIPEVPFLEKGIISEKQKDFRLYKSIFPADLKHTTLAFIGLLVPLGPTWPINELQARWASGVIAGHLKLPPMKDMQEEVSKVDQDTVMKWKRDTNFPIQYNDELAALIGCKPNIWHYLLTDPKLAKNLWYGPMFPFQWRMKGPHQWSKARERFMQAFDRTVTARKARTPSAYKPAGNKMNAQLFFLTVCAFGVMLLSLFIFH